jgi:hypothetical protein
MKNYIRLAFWRVSFWFARKHRGVTGFHATLSDKADTKSAGGRADLYRDYTRVIRSLHKRTPNAPDQARRQPSPEAGCSPRSVLRRLARVDISNPSDKLPAQRRVRDATDSSWNKTAKRIHSALAANAPAEARGTRRLGPVVGQGAK